MVVTDLQTNVTKGVTDGILVSGRIADRSDGRPIEYCADVWQTPIRMSDNRDIALSYDKSGKRAYRLTLSQSRDGDANEQRLFVMILFLSWPMDCHKR